MTLFMKKLNTLPCFLTLRPRLHEAMKGFALFTKLVVVCLVLAPVAKAQFQGTEDFSRPLSQQKWFPFTEGRGSISLSNQEFNFTSTSSSGEHEAGLAWVSTSVTNSQDWEFQIDVENMMSVSNSSHYGSIGIYVANENDDNDLAYLEFYSAYFDTLGQSVNGFTAGLQNNGTTLHEGDTFELPFDIGALRAKYDSSERSLAFYFHTGSTAESYFWQILAKYGLNGSDGTEANTNWGMQFGAGFEVGLYGTATGNRSSVGQLTADNFTTKQPSLGLHVVEFELEASLNPAGDAVALSWFSFDGLEYVVQESNDLVSWTDMATISGTGDYSGLEAPLTTPAEPRFYRIYSRIP
jgi:hypothetical protein|tara:strand:+ start:1286 stop:2341 length:1056 start_codon:yes stop_codon:yes gene_type:complete